MVEINKFIAKFSEESIVGIITCLITVIGSFITIIITIRNTNRNQKELARLQDHYFNENLREQKKIFDLSKKEENLRNSISMKPYFKISDNLKIIKRITQKDVFFDFYINLINVGNGTAINVSVLYKNDEKNRYIVYKDGFGDKIILYYYVSPIYDNIVRCNEYSKFTICCHEHKSPSKVHLKIKFQDMMERTYEQEFSFLYQCGRNNDEVLRIENYTPVLIEDMNKIE
ncbi:hypothetical protein [Clostridium cochlearium]|uniref:hypothetical protein n=1 Tax=Clostridium cochlearium TaxID=1494 RepID=UPI001C0EAD50|nr:hypothetical protein [Clostridium cochlearium]MBU5269423.1 hypothetical protein [Clostridium cochlearium]